MISKSLKSLLFLWLAAGWFQPAQAVTGDPTPQDEAALAIKADEQLADIGGTSVGDSVDMFTGNVSFQQTDVSLPGNSTLPVEITRHFDAAMKDVLPTISTLPFGTWDFNVPRITAVLATASPWPSNRCSSGWTPPIVAADSKTSYYGYQYSQGLQLKLTTSSALLLAFDSSTNYPAPSGSKFIAVDNIAFSCTSATDMTGASSGEGFIAYLPDGTRYILNRYISTAAKNLGGSPPLDCESNCRKSAGLTRYTANLFASQAIDRFGNTVSYGYDSSGHLTSISGSDGRSLTISWSNGYVSSVTDGSRTWTYQYNGSELTGVTRPDGTRWQFSLLTMFNARAGDPSNPALIGTKGMPATGTITSPYGLQASFTIDNTSQPVGNSPGTAVPIYYYTPGLRTKTLSGPGLSTQTWTYQYSNTQGWAAGGSGSTNKTISVTDPANTTTAYAYDIRFGWTEGLLNQVTVTGSDGYSRTETNTYVQTPVLGYWGSQRSYRDSHASRLTQKTVALSGSAYGTPDTYTVTYNTPDAFKNPTQVIQSNSFSSDSRTETKSYYNSATTSLWTIGQNAGSAYGGVQVSQITFNSLGMPQDSYSFGLKTTSRTYATDGTLYTVADGLGRTTKFENYMRGKPQKVTLPDNTVLNRTVTPSGVFNSFTDGRGNTTTLSYDAINRLTGVTFPSNDTVNWTPRTISYAFTTSSELGQPAGVFRARSVLGRQQKTTYYDATLHPSLVEQLDTTTGEARYISTQYDFRGNLAFKSYPSSSSNSSAGAYTRYDGFGRFSKTQLSDNTVTKSVSYLSGNRQAVSDATGHTTTITFQAFGEPETSDPLLIVAPENQTTTYNRDVFGNILSANRAGAGVSVTETNVYDTYHRLCKVIRPESGQHVIGLDAASQMTWSASGVTNGSPTQCDYSSVPSGTMTSYTYSPVGKTTAIHYADNTGDVTLGYDADGHLTSSANPSANWTYTYNKRGTLELATLSIDGRGFQIDPSYDAIGNLASESYPDGLFVSYAPNAWGEATTIGGFASITQRHATGRIKAGSFGNSLTYVTSLDARSRLSAQTVTGGSNLQSLSFAYNDDAQITTVTDNVDGSDTASYGYDGLHRLITANGIWGNYTYSYDAVGNMTGRGGPNALTYVYNSTTNTLSSVSGGSSRTYAYDTRGRVTSDGRFGFNWNLADQIVGEPGGATYSYDGNAKRVKTIQANGDVEYAFYDQSGKLRFTMVNGSGTDYLDLDGQTFVERTTAGTVTYLHPDWIGSPRMASNSTGAIVWREHFDPYGKKLNGVVEKRGFTGHAYDRETGLTYMLARYYDADVGRFLQTDPIGSKDDLNLYAYVHGNPTNDTDPSGTCAEDFCVVEAAALRAAVPAVVAAGAAIAATPVMIKAADAIGNAITGMMNKTDDKGGGDKGAADKQGTKDGDRAGKPMRPSDKQEVKDSNASKNNGTTKCDACGQETTPSKQSQKGVSPPGNETRVDHIYPQSKGGNGDASNGQILCNDCNGVKSNLTPDQLPSDFYPR